jgi:membrane-associated protein
VELLQTALDIVLHLDRHLIEVIQAYGVWTYVILVLIVFCETGLVVTPFLPGDSLLFAAGTLASRGMLNIWSLIGLLIAAAVAGDAANYWIGRYAGSAFVKDGKVRFIKREYLDRTHEFYERHGAKTIVLARFVPVIRTFAPFVAGLGTMTYWRFAIYNVVGGIVWVLLFVPGGYFFGNIPLIQRHFSLAVIGVILVSIVPLVVTAFRERDRATRNRQPAGVDPSRR